MDEVMIHMDKEENCPRCDNLVLAEIRIDSFGSKAFEDDSVEVKCEECGATLEVTYAVSLEVNGVNVTDIPSFDVDCPDCTETLVIENINQESGSRTPKCDGCGAVLQVNWFDWGRDMDVDVLEEGDNKDEDW